MDDRQPPPLPPRGDRAQATRERLLKAAIDRFGRHGFEASTREIARAADVNLAAIPYHFGGKHGLYLAAAEHIAQQVHARIEPALKQARLEVRGEIGAARARALLHGILEALARVMVDDAAASWARFVIREQMEPTDAFERLHAGAIGPIFETLVLLIARITGLEPEDRKVRIEIPRLVGQVVILRAGRATVLRELRWERIGEEEFAMIRRSIAASVATIARNDPGGDEGL